MTTVCVDVADVEATRREVEGAGPVHLLVNNAGVTELQPFLEVTEEAYEKCVLVDTQGTLSATFQGLQLLYAGHTKLICCCLGEPG